MNHILFSDNFQWCFTGYLNSVTGTLVPGSLFQSAQSGIYFKYSPENMWISFQNFLIDLDGEKSPNGLIGNGKFQFRVSLQNSFDLRIPTVNNFYIRRMNGLLTDLKMLNLVDGRSNQSTTWKIHQKIINKNAYCEAKCLPGGNFMIFPSSNIQSEFLPFFLRWFHFTVSVTVSYF